MDDIEVATALVGDVIAPATFLAGDKTLKTGTATAGVDVSDADALVGDVKSPKTFYSVAAPRKTGTMPTVAIVAANDNYPAGYHAGNAGGLDAIDTDLAPGNIKQGVNIFGKVGTYSPTPVLDDQSFDTNAEPTSTRKYVYREVVPITATSEVTLLTTTITLSVASDVFGACGAGFIATAENQVKIRLFIDGVQLQESAYITTKYHSRNLQDSRACSSGNRTVHITGRNYAVVDTYCSFLGGVFASVAKI